MFCHSNAESKTFSFNSDIFSVYKIPPCLYNEYSTVLLGFENDHFLAL